MLSQTKETDFLGKIMVCRVGCGACCIVPSISTPIPGMPEGKPAGIRCVQLSGDNHCNLFGQPERPEVCRVFKPEPAVCGSTNEEAFILISELEAGI